MPNNWDDHLQARADGEAPGFIGSDESIEHFLARTKAEADAAPPEQSVLVASGAAEGMWGEQSTPATPPRTRKVPAKKAPAKKAAARSRTR